MALSTTHVATGSILGSGVGKPGAQVRWAVAGRMAVAWLITLPAAGLVGALSYWLSDAVKSLTNSALAGDGLIFLVLVGLSFYMWWRAQQQKVDSSNVNADWDSSTNSVVPADVREAVKESKPTASVYHARQAKETLMTYFESILKVLVMGLLLGAGLPAVFAAGLVAYSNGSGGPDADGDHRRPQPGGEVPGHRAVPVRRLGDPHRRPLDHQGDDHPPHRYRPLPLHAQEMS